MLQIARRDTKRSPEEGNAEREDTRSKIPGNEEPSIQVGAGTKNTAEEVPWIGTVGHSTRPIDEHLEILKAARTDLLMDVRTIPRSRHNPQFDRAALPSSLAAAGIEYLHEPGLGGLRKPRADSPNSGWRNSGFRGYADYMMTPEFESHLERLIETARGQRVVLMCAEAVPWRCHRSLIADAIVVRGIPVTHLLGLGSARPHTLTKWAVIEGTRVTYPAPAVEGELFE